MVVVVVHLEAVEGLDEAASVLPEEVAIEVAFEGEVEAMRHTEACQRLV